MKKQQKLAKKNTHISETRQVQWEETIQQYLLAVSKLNKEEARSNRFLMFLQQLLNVEPNFANSYCTGIGQSLKIEHNALILKGEADNLFGNVVIEFKCDLLKKRTEAEDQLRRYVAILWPKESPKSRNLCIATDGIRFITYSPKLNKLEMKDIGAVLQTHIL